MPSTVLLVPGSLVALTGGSIYDRRMVEGLRALGWSVEVRELDPTFPEPTADALAGAAGALSAIADTELVVVDGLAFGAMPDVLGAHSSRLNLVALVHMPLALEVGIDAAVATRRRQAEVRALRLARAVVVTGRATIETLAAIGHGTPQPVLVEPGCDPAPLASGSDGRTPHLLCVAAVTRGKGHEGLLRAFAALDAPATLTCVGSLTRDPATADKVVRLVESWSLGDRASFVGELSAAALAAEYNRADVFVLNTLRETYGMAVSEALAHGLPVVSTRTGAIPDLVGSDGDAGILVDVGDDAAFRAALSAIVTDAGKRAHCRSAAVRARARLQPWSCAVQRLADVLSSIPRHV
jgi:glycosyltransferase involved in cell wall biosynthesis